MTNCCFKWFRAWGTRVDPKLATGKRSRSRGPRKARSGKGTSKGSSPPDEPRRTTLAQQAVGSFLRATRSSRNLTQEQVAAATRGSAWQLSRAAISAIERGQNFPGMEAMLALSNVLFVDPKELVERARLSTTVPVDISGRSYEELEIQAARHFWAGEFRQSLSVYDAMLEKVALERARQADDTARRMATLEVRRATVLKRAGALLSAIATAERAIALSVGYPDIHAEAYIVHADLQVIRGHLPLASDAAQRAIELTDGAEVKTRGWAFMVKARVLYLSEKYEEARQAFLEAGRCAREADDSRHLPHVEGNIGMCWLGQGRREEAAASLTSAVEMARDNGQPALEASWSVELGKIALTDGRHERADRYALAALEIAEPSEQYLTIFRAEWLRHRIQVAAGEPMVDRRRLGHLRELFLLLDQHEGIEEVQEFRKTALRLPTTDDRK